MKKAFIVALVLTIGLSAYAQALSETEASSFIDLAGLTEYKGIKLATGATVTRDQLKKENLVVDITLFGAVALENRAEGDADTHAIENTQAINAAVKLVASYGGGTVYVPEGTFRVYTIEMLDGVNLYLAKGSVLQAAKTETSDWRTKAVTPAEDYYEDGKPGNYNQPEVNLYAGLQDGGHTYFANSLIYAADRKNIMIYGEGLIDGSQMEASGSLSQVLAGNDPGNPSNRDAQITSWYGNKAIALVRCQNVVLSGISILNGGHFAIIMEGTRNMRVENMIVDTNRDAFNIDCGQDVTIIDSTFNSLTDDAIVFKASYGAGIYQSVQNCIVRNCTVSGYDAGSVLAGTYTTDKQVASDACGPTARIKFGTESTCGYNTVTIDSVTFQRSRGLCLESVDGSEIHDIIMVNASMDTVSSSPIFVRIGNRGRYPVTGNSDDTALNPKNNVRLTNTGWILPNDEDWQQYPIQDYYPVYNYNRNGSKQSNGVTVQVVDQAAPVKLNAANYAEENGRFFAYKWDDASSSYVVDHDNEILIDAEGVDQRAYYGDAVGYESIAKAYNLYIGNVQVTNADPRYPIELTGLVDSMIENVTLENVSVVYRGGMRMEDAVEQQQLSTSWEYTQYMTAPSKQNIPWLVNTFFAKNSALLPRVSWDSSAQAWVDDPYNVPEMQEQYPEPSNFGILPAYGLYARHIDGLKLIDVTFSTVVEDQRHAVVLDDAHNVSFSNFESDVAQDVKEVAVISNDYKRASGFEYVPNQEYLQTACSAIEGLEQDAILYHTVKSPEPGTPADSLYSYPTVADTASGYAYKENEWTYNGKIFSLPATVHRPFFTDLDAITVKVADVVSKRIEARNPAAETDGTRNQAASDASLAYSAVQLPEGASFDAVSQTFTFSAGQKGEYKAVFCADDGVIPVYGELLIIVE